MNLRVLKYFIAVVKEGTISIAQILETFSFYFASLSPRYDASYRFSSPAEPRLIGQTNRTRHKADNSSSNPAHGKPT